MKTSCFLCQKTHSSANRVSHSNIKTKRLQKANLQNKTIAGRRRKVCAQCIKGMGKQLKVQN